MKKEEFKTMINDKCDYRPLEDTFHVSYLDASTRDKAGMIIEDKIYLETEHIHAFGTYKKDTGKNAFQAPRVPFHVIDNNIFIDMIPIFATMPAYDAFNILEKKMEDYNIYMYNAKDKSVKLLHAA
jgi:hypothetical protein